MRRSDLGGAFKMATQVFFVDQSQTETNKSPSEAVDDTERPFFVPLIPGRMAAQVSGNAKVIAVNGAKVGFEIYPKIAEQFFNFQKTSLFLGEGIELRGKQASNVTSYLRARPLLNDSGGADVFGTGVIDQLKIFVLPEFRLTISFYNMLASRQSSAWPLWTEDKCQEMVKGINAIFQPQLNLSFEFQYLGNKILPGYRDSVAVDIPSYPKGQPSWRESHKYWLRHPPEPLGLHYYDVSPASSNDSWTCLNSKKPNPLGCDVADPALNRIMDRVDRLSVQEINLETALRQTPNRSDFDVYVFNAFEYPDPKQIRHGGWNLVQKCIISRDTSVTVLAHEIGHWLFEGASDMKQDHCEKDHNLMKASTGDRDWRLTRYQILAAHDMLVTYNVRKSFR
jgi:hypothetical protein